MEIDNIYSQDKVNAGIKAMVSTAKALGLNCLELQNASKAVYVASGNAVKMMLGDRRDDGVSMVELDNETMMP